MMPQSGAELTVVPMQPADWESVRAIYLEGIAGGNATFETAAPDWEKWNADRLPECRLVARSGAAVLGWAALTPVSTRRVYAGVAEASVYVSARARGQGVGTALIRSLIEASERAGIWTLQAGRRLPRQPRQPRPLPKSRFPRHRHARTGRLDARPLARCSPVRASQHRRRPLILEIPK